ncbi:MAG: MCE family protein [Acetobacter sp.]|nr:MCE family protein [Acetobacter sp.]
MFQVRFRQQAGSLIRLRYADEWIGVLVLISIALFVGAVIEAGVLSDWLSPPIRLNVVLPKTGVGGLTTGADVQILGAHAGTVRRIKLNPSGDMYAIVDLDPQVEPFIRRDSRAVIRKQFVVAGASYLDLTRGYGEPMDWSYAVVDASPEANPIDTITKTFQDIHDEILPMLANARDLTAQLDGMAKDIRAGKGSVGQILTDDRLIRQTEETIAGLHDVIQRLEPIEKQVGSVLGKADVTMGNMSAATGDLRKASPRLSSVMKSTDESLKELPALLTQARASMYSLQKLMIQLRGLWILGGSSTSDAGKRLPADAVQP